MSVFAVVLAAGSGKRFSGKGKKQFLKLGDRPILIHTLTLFEHVALVDKVICVVPKEDQTFAEDLISKYALSKVIKVMGGGSERQHSVTKAVCYLEQKGLPDDIVLVHDGVRPLVTNDLVTTLIQKLETVAAVVSARRVTDSLKIVSGDGMIQQSLPRTAVWAMQTPQVFRLSIIAEACRLGAADRFAATDEAMLVERLGVPILCVEGPAENIKITTASDLAFAELLLRERSSGHALS